MNKRQARSEGTIVICVCGRFAMKHLRGAELLLLPLLMPPPCRIAEQLRCSRPMALRTQGYDPSVHLLPRAAAPPMPVPVTVPPPTPRPLLTTTDLAVM